MHSQCLEMVSREMPLVRYVLSSLRRILYGLSIVSMIHSDTGVIFYLSSIYRRSRNNDVRHSSLPVQKSSPLSPVSGLGVVKMSLFPHEPLVYQESMGRRSMEVYENSFKITSAFNSSSTRQPSTILSDHDRKTYSKDSSEKTLKKIYDRNTRVPLQQNVKAKVVLQNRSEKDSKKYLRRVSASIQNKHHGLSPGRY